jgi:hypothetical protein
MAEPTRRSRVKLIEAPNFPYELPDYLLKQNLRIVFDSLLTKCLPHLAGAELYVRKERPFLAWKRLGPNASAPRLYYLWVTRYDSATYRLRNDHDASWDLTKKFWPLTEKISRYYGGGNLWRNDKFELSFIAEDLADFSGAALVRFVESNFDSPKAVYEWPLFSHDESYPTYAWTISAEKDYERRRKIREALMAKAKAQKKQ